MPQRDGAVDNMSAPSDADASGTTLVTVVLTLHVAAWLVLQTGVWLIFAHKLFFFKRHSTRVDMDDDGARKLPKAAVIMCLRGGDPFLKKTLRGLMTLNYPADRYAVHVVVDGEQDPANAVVLDAVSKENAENKSKIRVQYLKQPVSDSCSLKASSLVQAASALDASFDFIVQIDADVVVHPNWLREIAGSFQDERVGAVTGNRWYMPEHISAASMLRYVWNVPAAILMIVLRIPWGGTLAIRTALLHETDLLQKWKCCFTEDTMLASHLWKHGYTLAFNPLLMAINREDCNVKDFFRWVCRQLLLAKMYHPGYPLVFAHGLLMPLAIWLLTIITFLVTSAPYAYALRLLLTLTACSVGQALLIVITEMGIRRILKTRGEEISSFQWLDMLSIFKICTVLAFPAQYMQINAVWSICADKINVEWRGIEYTLQKAKAGNKKSPLPWTTHLHAYCPYAIAQKEGDSVM